MFSLDVFALAVAAYLLYRLAKRSSYVSLPPGPKGLPIVGNAFSMPKGYDWITYHKWSQELDTDILYLNMMGKSVIVLDKAKPVSDLLEKRSSIYSSRPPSTFLDDLIGTRFNTGILKYGETWRQHRRVAHSFFGSNVPTNYRPQSLRAARNLMGRLLDDSKDIKTELQYMAGETIMSLCYGLDITSDNGPRYLEIAQKGTQAIIDGMLPGRFLVDVFPVLKYVPEWMPGAGFQTVARKSRKIVDDMLQIPFRAATSNLAAGTCPPCFACTTLQDTQHQPKGVDIEEITQGVTATMYGAGADTTVSTLTSCILGLLGRPDVLQRARADLDRVVKLGHLPDFDDEPALPFIKAIVKEALRWREVAPLGVPHYLEVEDEYAGYRIPAGSIIMANQWALLHDEEYYPEPFLFKPERFMNGDEYNSETKDPEFACWGFGRRICAGRFMAYSAVWITVASLIYAFDIEKEVDKEGRPIEPNPQYSSGLVFAPESFPCSFKPRSAEFAKLIRTTIQDSRLDSSQ